MKQFFLSASLALAFVTPSLAAEETAACRAGIEACHVACKRFDFKDAKRAACDDFCGPRLKSCGGVPQIFTKEAVKPPAVVAPVAEKKVEPPPASIEPKVESPARETEAKSEATSDASTNASEKAGESSESTAPAAEHAAESSAESKTESVVAASEEVKAEPKPEPSEPKPEVAAAPAEPSPVSAPVASGLNVPVLTTKRAAVKEADQNTELLSAIATGNQKIIRRLIESKALDPTYVYAHDFNTQTRQYDGRIVRLRLVDLFNDNSTVRTDATSLDRVFSLFLELGMDVTAKLSDKTAWGPSLRTMETAKDRDARLKMFDMALEKGLMPNNDLTEWLFAELPQVCGRDRSKFAISVVDVLVNRMGPNLKHNFWRESARGPETLSDVLDSSFSQPGKNAYEKELAAAQDKVWENCAPLSRRINKFLVQGN